ncbi:MAG: hypothetical protein JWN40_2293 [Phycisphaerales bacterium]|nr:hypothetical protein [Phycisphaerales bacterium]
MAVLVAAAGCKEDRKGGSSGAGSSSSPSSGSSSVESPKSPPTASRLWTQAEVEAWIREDLALVETSLAPGSGGSYTGTGKDEGGVVYKLNVTQRPGEIVLDHESPARTAPGKVTTGQIKFGK